MQALLILAHTTVCFSAKPIMEDSILTDDLWKSAPEPSHQSSLTSDMLSVNFWLDDTLSLVEKLYKGFEHCGPRDMRWSSTVKVCMNCQQEQTTCFV